MLQVGIKCCMYVCILHVSMYVACIYVCCMYLSMLHVSMYVACIYACMRVSMRVCVSSNKKMYLNYTIHKLPCLHAIFRKQWVFSRLSADVLWEFILL